MVRELERIWHTHAHIHAEDWHPVEVDTFTYSHAFSILRKASRPIGIDAFTHAYANACCTFHMYGKKT